MRAQLNEELDFVDEAKEATVNLIELHQRPIYEIDF